MFSLRDVVIFIAGAAFFHTLSHIILPLYFKLPLDLGFMVLTPTLNIWIIIISLIITILLLWWAYRLSNKLV